MRKTNVTEANLELLKELSNTIDYIDIDDPRFNIKVTMSRIAKGASRKTSLDRYVLSDTSIKLDVPKMVFEMPGVEEYEELVLRNAEALDNCTYTTEDLTTHIQQSNKVYRLYILINGYVGFFGSFGIDDSGNSAFTCIGDDNAVNLWASYFREKYTTNRRITCNQVVGFTSQGPIVNRTSYTRDELATIGGKDEFYPYIEEGVDKLAEDFNKSNASILILIGERGTGKTSILRSLIHKLNREKNVLASDENVITNPGFLPYLVSEGVDTTIAIEDADNLIGERSEGNNQMSALLNLTDGIVSSNVKMIISTNLSSLNKVDSALYRPGRTFKVIQFKRLSLEEANKARESVGKSPIDFEGIGFKKSELTLAEALNFEEYEEYKGLLGVGFV